MRALVIAFACSVVFACGSFGGDDADDFEAATLSIDPQTRELLILDGVPATADYTATLTWPDGRTRDVSNEVRFSVDEGYGRFNGHTLSMHVAGKTQVFASFSDKLASAQVLARLRTVRVDPSLPAGAKGWFDLPEDGTRAPVIVYPPADVIMPRNLGDFEVHWTDAVNNIFEISLKTEFADVRVLVAGGNGVIANGSWSQFLASEWLAAVGYEPIVQYNVRGVDSNNPTSVGSKPARLVQLGNESMLGGLYYWAATAQNGPYGIFRHDMSKPGQPAEEFMTTAQTGGRCVACHVLSRDGSKMAVTYDGGNGAATLVDVSTKSAQASQRGWNFGTFTPDGNQLLAVQNGTLTVVDYATQATMTTMTSAGSVTHPDLSVDGKNLVYVQRGSGGDWSFQGGQIYTRTYDPATRVFGPERPLIADSSNNFYPSFSPDGKWVLYNKAAAGSAYNNGDATLWVVKADGTGQPVELSKSNAGLGLTNSWGRWAPFAQTFGPNNEQIFWITVSSTRAFGVRLEAGRPQLWMTPFIASASSATLDPSAPAFRLPFQNISSNNHIAQWTEQIVAPQ